VVWNGDGAKALASSRAWLSLVELVALMVGLRWAVKANLPGVTLPVRQLGLGNLCKNPFLHQQYGLE
jgi:hypothetical protein